MPIVLTWSELVTGTGTVVIVLGCPKAAPVTPMAM